MIDVPIGCRDRHDFIKRRADELSATYQNGNKKDLLAGLEELPPRVAFAVLAVIMSKGTVPSVARFLQEMA